MGPGDSGWCRQKGILQAGSCLLALLCLGSVIYLYTHLQEKVQSSENLLLKFKQLQEALSAQVQEEYELQSWLKQAIQKERAEHKKTKEEFELFKLEFEEALNKEKEDAINRYVALPSRHMILKNQHEEAKKKLQDLLVLYNSLKLENRRMLESHNQKYAQLKREHEKHMEMLLNMISKLIEESMVLRNAHEEVRSKLHSAQVSCVACR
ncbi:Golgi integral membrane protein 4-like isoform X1 [Lissotriton helveticus]